MTSLQPRALALLPGLLLLLTSCGSACRGGPAAPPVDAGPADSGLDATPDARPDRQAPDASVDAEPEDPGPQDPNIVEMPIQVHMDMMMAHYGWPHVAWMEYLSDGQYEGTHAVVYDLTTGNATDVITGPRGYHPEYVYHGQVLYEDFGESPFIKTDMYLYDVASGQTTRVTDTPGRTDKGVMSDDWFLYVDSADCTDYHQRLVAQDRHTDATMYLTECWEDPESLAVSNDRAAWTARPEPGWYYKNIVVYDFRTQEYQVLDPQLNAFQFQPTLEGDLVVWEDRRAGRDVYVKNLVTGEIKCLTPNPYDQTDPFLRDGLVVWCDYRYSKKYLEKDPCDVYVYELATGVGRRVTNKAADYRPQYVDHGWVVYTKKLHGYEDGDGYVYAQDLIGDGILTQDGKHVIPYVPPDNSP